MAAIFVPSGDHTGPQPPRESIESIGTGAYHRSPPPESFAGSAEIVSTWFVPSRNRFVRGATSANAIRLPSGDQVGGPGCGSVSCTFVTTPVAPSSTDLAA